MRLGQVSARFAYEPQLDGLRACAVLAVIVHHAPTRVGEGGYIGVDVFFVLSGFLITTLLTRELAATGHVSFRDFYVRRIRRLGPALLAVTGAVVAVWLIVPTVSNRAGTLRGAPIALLYVSSWVAAFQTTSLGWFGHTWSLSVEEHFYLLWPLAFLALARRSPRLLAWATVGVAAASASEWYAGYARGWSNPRLFFAPDTRAKDILVGCLLAVLVDRAIVGRESLFNAASIVAATILGSWALVVPQDSVFYLLGWPLVLTAAAALIASCHLSPRSLVPRLLTHRWLVWIGVRSYAAYLIHFPVTALNGAVIHWQRGEKAAVFIVYVASTLALADVCHRFIESRFKRRSTLAAA